MLYCANDRMLKWPQAKLPIAFSSNICHTVTLGGLQCCFFAFIASPTSQSQAVNVVSSQWFYACWAACCGCSLWDNLRGSDKCSSSSSSSSSSSRGTSSSSLSYQLTPATSSRLKCAATRLHCIVYCATGTLPPDQRVVRVYSLRNHSIYCVEFQFFLSPLLTPNLSQVK